MWSLLRIWHAEALESVIGHPQGAHFLRTSYLTAPDRWRDLPASALRNRVEQVLVAAYRQRDWSIAQTDDPTRMLLFAYWYEWVEHADHPADTGAESRPWVFSQQVVDEHLMVRALADFHLAAGSARPGIDARAYTGAFEVIRIDQDDSWHLVRPADRAELFAERFE